MAYLKRKSTATEDFYVTSLYVPARHQLFQRRIHLTVNLGDHDYGNVGSEADNGLFNDGRVACNSRIRNLKPFGFTKLNIEAWGNSFYFVPIEFPLLYNLPRNHNSYFWNIFVFHHSITES